MAKNKIHFIGCGGVSMSALMALAKKAGHKVTGSDLKIAGHSKENIKSDFDLVVYTASITPGSPGELELKRAQELGVKTISRGEYLATLTNTAKQSIIISGMHGKTTVTTMTGLVLRAAGHKPTVLPGTFVKEFKANFLAGDANLIVSEGCEYYDSFLNLKPKIAVITNIEAEHLDYFGTLEKIIFSFAHFIENIDQKGVLIYKGDDQNILKAIQAAKRKPKKLIAYGSDSDQKYSKLDFKLAIPGQHNRENALAVLAVSDYLNIDREISEKSLANYRGAARRLEIKGEQKGILVIDDYGHHPTEIQKTLQALKEFYPNKRLVVAFWPHQYKRIASLFDDFSRCFQGADEVLLLPIYLVPGRDEKLALTSESLAKAINKQGQPAKVFQNQETMVEYLKNKLADNDLLLTIGIPPINQVAEKFLEAIK